LIIAEKDQIFKIFQIFIFLLTKYILMSIIEIKICAICLLAFVLTGLHLAQFTYIYKNLTKEKNMKKLFAIILVSAMIFAFIAACANENVPDATQPDTDSSAVDTDPPDTDTDTPHVDTPTPASAGGPLEPFPETVTIRVGMGFGTPEGDVPGGTTPENMTWNEILYNDLNIRLEWMWSVPSDQAAERLQLALATGDLPDIISFYSFVDFLEAAEHGLLVDLSNAFESTVGRPIREQYEFFGDVPLDRVTRDGQLFGFPDVIDTYQNMPLIWYRADWADELGISAPTTFEELVDMGRAFVDNGMGGADTTAFGLFESPIHWAPDARGFFQAYGAYPETWIQGGDGIVFGTVQSETQQALLRMRSLYSEGLINPEFGTMNMDQLLEDIIAGKVGIVFGEWWLPAWPFNMHVDADPDARWEATTIVTVDGSEGIVSIPGNNVTLVRGVTANAPPEAAEAMFKIANLHWEFTDASDEEREERWPGLWRPEDGMVWNWLPVRINDAMTQYRNYMEVNRAIDTGNTHYLTNPAQWNLYNCFQWVINDIPHPDEDLTFGNAWGLYASRVSHTAGYGINMRIVESGNYILNEYFGAPTPTQIDRFSILDDMWREFFVTFVMGTVSELLGVSS